MLSHQIANLHRAKALMIKSSFIEMDFRNIGRATGSIWLFSLSSLVEDFRRLLRIGLPALGGSGRLNAFEPLSVIFGWNGDEISEIVFNTSGVVGSIGGRCTLLSVKLRQRLSNGTLVSAHDLILPLIIVLNDVGNWALSSISSISNSSMQSSSIDSIESDERLLNERKQLVAVAAATVCIFGGDGVSIRLGGKALGCTKSNSFRHFFCDAP